MISCFFFLCLSCFISCWNLIWAFWSVINNFFLSFNLPEFTYTYSSSYTHAHPFSYYYYHTTQIHCPSGSSFQLSKEMIPNGMWWRMCWHHTGFKKKSLYVTKILMYNRNLAKTTHYKDCIYLHSSSMIRETWVQSQVKSYQRLKKWYLMPLYLTLTHYPYLKVAPSRERSSTLPYTLV